jgi:mitotic spindle assembly checkpoint protein MAD1
MPKSRADRPGQSQHLVSQDKTNAALLIEVAELRAKRKEAEGNERMAKEMERQLREEIRVLHDQVERARRDFE